MGYSKKEITIVALISVNLDKIIFDKLIMFLQDEFKCTIYIINFESWYRRNVNLDGYNCIRLIPENTVHTNIWEETNVYSAFHSYISILENNLIAFINEKKRKIDFYFSFDDAGLFDKLCIKIFNNFNIPTIFIPQGYIPKITITYANYLLTRFKALIFPDRYAEHVCPYGLNGSKFIFAINDDQYIFYKFWGWGISKVFTIGYVYGDKLYEKFQLLGSNNYRKNSLIYLSSDYDSFSRDFLSQFKENILPVLISKFENVSILLKPGEEKDNWSDVADDFINLKIIENSNDINKTYDTILDYEFVAGSTTQLLFEAGILKKKIFIIESNSKKYYDYYGLLKHTKLSLFNETNIASFTLDAPIQLSSAEINFLTKLNFGHFDGKNAKRAADQICKLLR